MTVRLCTFVGALPGVLCKHVPEFGVTDILPKIYYPGCILPTRAAAEVATAATFDFKPLSGEDFRAMAPLVPHGGIPLPRAASPGVVATWASYSVC